MANANSTAVMKYFLELDKTQKDKGGREYDQQSS